MTVSSTSRRVNYAGDGVSTLFPVPFRFDDNTHLRVVSTSAAGIETVLTLNVAYTVTGAGSPSGGTLTMLAAPAAATTLAIKRIVPRLQAVDFTPFDAFPAETQERIADRLTMITQEDADDLGRALLVPETDAAIGSLLIPTAADRAGRILAFGPSGLPVVGPSADILASLLAVAPAGLPNMSAVTNMSALRNLAFAALATGSAVMMLGYYVAGDGGGGGFTWNAASTATDDSGLVINPTGNAGAGRWLRIVDDALRPEWFGANSTSATDSAALKAAILAATTLGAPIILPLRRFYWDGTAITADKVRLWGQGMPRVNAGKTALVGGSIIEGPLVLTGRYIDLRDLGVDLGTAGAGADADGIKCTVTPYNTGEHLHTENIVALCKYKTSAVHALLFEGFAKHTGNNLYSANGYFNCVIKNRSVQIGYIDCDTSKETGLYLKSDNLYGSCSEVQIGAVRTRGNDEFGVRVQGDSANIENIQIGQIHGADHQRTVCVQLLTGIQASRINLGAVISERSSIADVSFLQGNAAGSMFSVGFESLETHDTAGQVIETSAPLGYSINHLFGCRVYASYVAASSQATMDSAIYIDVAVNSSNFQNVEIVENYGVGSKIGALNYANNASPPANMLGQRRAKTKGTGIPRAGVLSQTLSGAAATLLIAIDTGGDGKSIAAVTIAAPTTVTTFAPELSGQEFSVGDTLLITNLNASALTIAHNPAGGIINQSAASVVLATNEVCQWINVGGALWSQIKIA